jgi:hypothetical protein
MNPSTIAIFTEKREEKQGRKMATSRSDEGFNEVSEPCSDTQEDYDFAVISRLWRDSSLKEKKNKKERQRRGIVECKHLCLRFFFSFPSEVWIRRLGFVTNEK